MQVLYFADTRFPIERANGLQTMATCHALAAAGHDVRLVVRPDTAPAPRDPFDFYHFDRTPRLTIDAVPAPGGPGRRRVRYLLDAVAMATGDPAVVVYTRDLGLAALLLRLPASRRPPVIYESHGMAAVVAGELPGLLGRPALAPTPAKLRRLDRRDRRAWMRAAAYVTITRGLADDLEARYGARANVFVVPDGAREVSIGTRPPLSDSQAVAAYAGHLYPWKGVDVLVQALALEPRLRGLVVGGHPGEPDRARIEALARTHGVADRLEITGLVAPAEVPAHLARATVLVLPNTASTMSERYTSPLKLFEYLWYGRPIVASDTAAIREILTHEATALLVPAGDARALAAALTRAAFDWHLNEALGAAARRLAPEFTWARRAARLEPALAAAVRP